ncbi:EAL domain-containing protein [Klenkia sp. PcliD-1-E]|uniref:putative bifunctional diguanylate cyclase/phosphodiesterase n=1 Tax=Klenkia sp. PcliD-1-E TaxID=2954492 RepID=UPI002097B833|nr:EAL domain-containing protein [Klenkia sp. PcliD-1-E]MCO7218370.1 EAL domain-containing protein [Klenkia sp. PcliD-1-E]
MDTTATGADPAPARARRILVDPRSVLVAGMAVAMAGLALALGLPVASNPALDGAVVLPWWLLAALFAATEACVMHIQTGREAQTVSVSELVVVLGLFYAAPAELVAGNLLGSAVILLVHRRSSVLKTLWNMASLSLQMVVAITVFRVLNNAGDATHWLAWVAACAGCLVANRVSVLAVAGVMAIYDGAPPLAPLLREVVTGDPASPVVVTLGLIAATSLAATPAAVVLLLVMGAGLLIGYRAYAALSDRHLSLERLYRFTQAISSSPEVDEVLRSVLAEAKDLLHAEHAEAVFVGAEGGALARVRLGPTGRLTRSEDLPGAAEQWLLDQVMQEGTSLTVPRGTRDTDERAWLEVHGARDAVAVPLRSGAGVLGAIIVTDRLGEVRTFEDGDVLMLETVATHANVALQNGELISQLRHDALHDALTGLPNRALLQRRLAALLGDGGPGRTPAGAVVILDLNGFKDVNDTLGHHQGDLLLVEVGARLRTCVGADGLVVRLGGDEFAVLLEGADEGAALEAGRRILGELRTPVLLDGVEVEVSGSLGIALSPQHATDPAALLKRADVAMYEAKRTGEGLRLYEAHLDPNDVNRLALVAELRAALTTDDIQVHVQPQGRTENGRVCSVEALVRWNHPTRGRISPEEFIPIAERSGLIGALTTRVLDASLAAVAHWRRSGHDLSIAVNLSSRSLLDPGLVDEVAQLLSHHGVPPVALTLEVTEGSVMADPTRAISLLRELRQLGVRLSVDDFGTGYSSLSYLQRLPIDEVKIDKSFVADMLHRPGDTSIVRAVADLGRNLGLDVVAEGVEDQDTWDALTELGVHLIQGWHLARPMPVDALLSWLDDRAATAAKAVLAT